MTGARPGAGLQIELRGSKGLEDAIRRAGRRIALAFAGGAALLAAVLAAAADSIDTLGADHARRRRWARRARARTRAHAAALAARLRAQAPLEDDREQRHQRSDDEPLDRPDEAPHARSTLRRTRSRVAEFGEPLPASLRGLWAAQAFMRMRFVVGSRRRGRALDAAVGRAAPRTATRSRCSSAASGRTSRGSVARGGRRRRGRPGVLFCWTGTGHGDGRKQGAGRARGARLGPVDRRGRAPLERRERARDEPEADEPRNGARDRRRLARRSRRRTRTSAANIAKLDATVIRRHRLGDDLRAGDRRRGRSSSRWRRSLGAFGQQGRPRRRANAARRAPAAARALAPR